MALDSTSRWEFLRQIIGRKSTGTLTLQMGRSYQYWMIQAGKVICVSSTLPEQSFTQFILQNKYISCEDVCKAQLQVAESRALGAVLVRMRIATADGVRDLLRQHWISLAHNLLQSSHHCFWSHREIQPKLEYVSMAIPLAQVILCCERSSVEIHSAVRFAQKLPRPYRVTDWSAVEAGLAEHEKRILHYLKNGCSLPEILRDPELDRLTCYRILFLLWTSGYLQDRTSKIRTAALKKRSQFMERVKSIPPDWIFPLVAGVLIGILLAPGPRSEPTKEDPPQRMETLKDAMDKPAWATEDKTTEATENRATESAEDTDGRDAEGVKKGMRR